MENINKFKWSYKTIETAIAFAKNYATWAGQTEMLRETFCKAIEIVSFYFRMEDAISSYNAIANLAAINELYLAEDENRIFFQNLCNCIATDINNALNSN